MSTIFKYIFHSFIIFCVVYTLQDCYTKRRKFMWVLYLVKRNIHIITYAFVGDELYSTWLCTRPKKLKKKN